MPSLKALKTLCGVSAAVLILSGCGGGGSGSGSSAAVASSPPSSATGSSGSSGTSGSSGGSGTTTTNPPPTGSAKLTWTAPTANTNGSALTNLAGYYIYYGTNSASLGTMVNVASSSTLTYTVTGLGAGTWYFAIAAYTNDGLTSPMSNVGSKTIT